MPGVHYPCQNTPLERISRHSESMDRGEIGLKTKGLGGGGGLIESTHFTNFSVL